MTENNVNKRIKTFAAAILDSRRGSHNLLSGWLQHLNTSITKTTQKRLHPLTCIHALYLNIFEMFCAL